MTSERKIRTAAFAVICAVYIALRLRRLSDSCLWFDEIFSVHAAQMNFADLFWFVAQDLIHPPLFYVLLKFWILIGGDELYWLRLFPILFSIVALIPFYFICRRLKLNYPAIALALALFAVNGALIKYAQEVRMYSVLLCLSLFSLWLFSRYFNLGKSFIILTIVNVALIYTHYFGWLVVISEVAAVLILQRIKARQMLTSLAVCLLAFVPWFYAVWRASRINADVNQNLGWAGKPNLTTVFQFVFDLCEPFYFQMSSIDASSVYFVSVPILLIVIAAFAFCLFDRKKLAGDEKRNLYLLSVFIVTPVIVAFIASWILPFSVWGTRHLIVVFAPFIILTAFVVANLKIEILKVAAFSAIAAFTLFAFVLELTRPTPQFIWCAWEDAARNLNAEQPTRIYVFEDLVAYHLWFAVRDSGKFEIVRVGDIEELAEDKAYFLPRGFDAVRRADANEISDERFYIAFSGREFDERNQPLVFFKQKGYKIGEQKSFKADGLNAYLVEISK